MTVKNRAALISLSNKDGIEELVKGLDKLGFQILSTGNTAKAIEALGVAVTRVSDVTGFPEIMGGRVKTLHPLIHGGLLGDRSKQEHLDAMEKYKIPNIEVVCVNLYPFKEVIKDENISLDVAIENIDIGGPAMLRASAKNYHHISVVVDSNDYSRLLTELQNEKPSLKFRQELAIKAFKHTRDYDTAIATYFDRITSKIGDSNETDDAHFLPEKLSIDVVKVSDLRYGENPHQKAAIYRREKNEGAILAKPFSQLNGKELSYNNLVDLDAALNLVAEFKEPAAAIIKHTNPAGCAVSDSLITAFEMALACDPVSAFGGIVALNRHVEENVAKKLSESFYEIVSAPSYDEKALEILSKKKNLRIITHPEDLVFPKVSYRNSPLGLIVQNTDPIISLEIDSKDLNVVTNREPTEQELESLLFAWRVCKHVKSNAIVFAHGTQTVGVGAGQMSRIDSVEIAARKANFDLRGSVLASDAFFPFKDGVLEGVKAGITAIIQPGGSKRDQEVIDAANEHNIAMVFTGKRHFRH